MAFLRFSVLSVVSLCSVVLFACGAQQNVSTSNPTNSPASEGGRHAGMNHDGKKAEDVPTGEAKDLDYMVKLGLIKGHMYVAKELLELGKPEQAEPHIGHPVEEIYADLEGQLSERGVAEFKTTLTGLHDTVKAGAKDQAKVEQDFAAAMNAVDDAIAKLPESQRKSPKFVMQIITGLLETAKDEYKAAIVDGKITEPIEYQDSRGFVRYASELYQSVSAGLKPETSGKLTKILADLSTAWPEALPPAVSVKSPEQVEGLVKEVELAAQAAQL